MFKRVFVPGRKRQGHPHVAFSALVVEAARFGVSTSIFLPSLWLPATFLPLISAIHPPSPSLGWLHLLGYIIEVEGRATAAISTSRARCRGG